MSLYPYTITGGAPLEALATNYLARTTENTPRIPDRVTYRVFIDDVTGDFMLGRSGLDGRAATHKVVNYTWQEVAPGLPLWKGTTSELEKRLQTIAVSFEARSRKVTQEMDTRRLVFDQFNADELAVARTSGDWQRHVSAWDRFIVGETNTHGLAFDGQTFFDVDHPGLGGAPQSNLEAGVFALNDTNLSAVTTDMIQYRRQDGTPYGLNVSAASSESPEVNRIDRNNGPAKYHIFVGANLKSTVEDLARVSKEVPGPNAGMFTWSTVDEITKSAQPNSWYVFFPREASTTPASPLFYVTQPSWGGANDNLDEKRHEFYHHEEWGYAYWAWWTMFKAVNQ